MKRIAFLGLGAMGSRMAIRLAEAGFDLTVWNRSKAATEPFRARGVRVADTPADAAESAEVVISMLTDDAAAQSVWLSGETGAINGLSKSAIALEVSTVSPDWIRELGLAIVSKGARMLDAPVAGSRPQAEAGQLIFMLGGDVATADAVRPVLTPMAAAIHHIGGAGHGAAMKLAVNGFFAAQLASMAEMLGYLAKSGIQPDHAAAILAQFPVVSPALAGAARMMAAGESSPMFPIDLIVKDLEYVRTAASQIGSALPGASAALNAFKAAQAAGVGTRHVTALASSYLN
jgi:3-hydroxyisobutyrate dehydrogenase